MTTYSTLGLWTRTFGGGLALTMLTSGCVVPKVVGDGLGTEGGEGSGSEGATETTPMGSDGSDGSGDSGSEGSGGMPSVCGDDPRYQCSAPYDCGAFPCGGLDDWFDADGCIRQGCGGDEDCGAGEVCYRPLDYGGCVSSGMDCFEEPDGSCTCGADPDCGGQYCVAQEAIPGGTCFGQPDEPACLGEGCSDFRTVVEISDTCECTLDAPLCLMFGPDGTGGASDYFWHEDSGTVAYFELGPLDALPYGWRRCTDADAPAACGCNAPMTEPMCP